MEKFGQTQWEEWEAGKHQHMSLCLALCWLLLVLRARNWEIVPKVEGFGHFIHSRVCWTVAVTLVPEKIPLGLSLSVKADPSPLLGFGLYEQNRAVFISDFTQGVFTKQAGHGRWLVFLSCP